jgi:two-component system phosphate regulon response regulator PhoB
MSRILVVEDEPAVALLIEMNLRHAGHEVVMAADGQQAQAAVDAALPDLVLLDWMLPDASGIVLARRWRAAARTKALPIIMLTARAEEPDKVAGLDAGADDYLTKPFLAGELLARIRALLRRKLPEALDSVLEVGGLRLDPATHRVTHAAGGREGGSRELKLGPTEFRLLNFLMAHPERVHSRAQLLDKVWGDHVFIEERTVDVHVKRLREALAPAGCAGLIETVRGAGYRLARSSAAAGATGAAVATELDGRAADDEA